MKKEKKEKGKKETEEKILKSGPALALSGQKSAEQKNLFGDKDQIYNTIQAEISIIVATIKANWDSIDKKKDQNTALQKRKDNLEKAARSVATIRDEELKRKKEEKLKK